MVSPRSLGLAAALLMSAAPVHAHDFCARLRAFEASPFAKDVDGQPKRLWIEFRWVGYWMDFEHGFGVSCTDSGTPAGKAFCAWLKDNTSVEFHSQLPMRIMTCHGYRFPEAAGTSWNVALGSIAFWESGRSGLLEIDQRDHRSRNSAIRLSVFEEHQDEATQPLPPILPDDDVLPVRDLTRP